MAIGSCAAELRQQWLVDVIGTKLPVMHHPFQWWELDLCDLRPMVEHDPELLFHPTSARIAAWIAERST
jgi:hypothetical protein